MAVQHAALSLSDVDQLLREGNSDEARDVLALIHTLQHDTVGHYTDALFLAEDKVPQLGYDARGRPFLFGYPFESFRNGVSEAVVEVEIDVEVDLAEAQDSDATRAELLKLEGAITACYYRFCVHERFLPGVCFAAVHVLCHLADGAPEVTKFSTVNEDYQRRVEAV